jgi:hypothetical protein
MIKGEELSKLAATPQTTAPVDLNAGSTADDGDEDDEDKIAAAAKKLAGDPEFMGDKAGAKSTAGDIKPAGQAAKKAGVH